MTSSVSIVIPSWNGLELLKRFLPTVIEATVQYSTQFDAATEIVVVDDGSVDQSADWLRSQGFAERPEPETERDTKTISSMTLTRDQMRLPSLKLTRNETNRGFGDACNRGFQCAKYPLVFLLNNDVEVDVNSIVPLVENFADSSVFAAHCRVFELSTGQECGTGKVGSFSRGFIRVHESYVPRGVRIVGQVNRGMPGVQGPLYSLFAGGGSAMFDRTKFLEMGGFEPLLSPFYWEDVELSYRAWKRGYVVLFEPRSVTRHRVSSTIGKLDQRAVREIDQRNRLIYHWIHLHSLSMMASHILWILLLSASSPLRLNPGFISSFIAAFKLLPLIRRRRLAEKRAARRSDREVFDIFSSLKEREDVFAYDDYAKLEANN
ncbi:MAG TPA: glycosyltransferase [Blastocatellia bacterium]|nr:glycosyltransferase [Blastocatellia bacterium]